MEQSRLRESPFPSGNFLFIISIAFCIVTITLAQIGIWYLIISFSMIYFLAAVPLCYLLVCGLGAFCTTERLDLVQARKKGGRFGTIVGRGSVMLAILVMVVVVFWALQQIQSICALQKPNCWISVAIARELLFFFVLGLLVTNLLSLALAALGGRLGGNLRARMFRGKGPVQE